MVVPSFSLLRCFSSLKDPRTSRRKKKHLLIDIVTIAICAVIAGADDWPKIEAFGRARIAWLTTFLALPNGIPRNHNVPSPHQSLAQCLIMKFSIRRVPCGHQHRRMFL